jgi:hypothetical protein
MKRRNILIIALLLLGLGTLALVEGYLKPELRKEKEQYLAGQKDPLTHDFGRLLRFKSPYMGDASNLSNLNADLPLGEIPRMFQLDPDNLTAEITYQGSIDSLETDLFERALVYNATANFVLIGNLETLHLNFENGSYSITRRAVEGWYGTGLDSLQEESRWREKVQRPLADRAAVTSFITENFDQ